jgi:hypothetical protein
MIWHLGQVVKLQVCCAAPRGLRRLSSTQKSDRPIRISRSFLHFNMGRELVNVDEHRMAKANTGMPVRRRDSEDGHAYARGL